MTSAAKASARAALRLATSDYRAALRDLDALRQPLARLEAAAAAEAEAASALADIESAEEARLAAWAQTGHGAMPSPDAKGRAAAEARLSQARATATAARAAMARLNGEAAAAARRADTAAVALRAPQVAVLLAEAEAMAEAYLEAAGRAAEAWGALRGLDRMIADTFGDMTITGPSGGRLAGFVHDRRQSAREFPTLGFDLAALEGRPIFSIPVKGEWLEAGAAAGRAALEAAVSDAEG